MVLTRNTLLFCLMAGNLLIVVIIFGVAGVVSYRSLDAQYLGEVEAYQHQLAGIAKQYVERLWPVPDPDMDRLCKQFTAEVPPYDQKSPEAGPSMGLPIRLTVIAADGRVLGDSQRDPVAMANHKTQDRPEVLQALEGNLGKDTRRSETLAIHYRYIAMPIACKGETVGAVRISMPVVAITQAEDVIRDTILWAAATSIIAFALVGALVNWVWHRLLMQVPPDGSSQE